MSFSFWEHRHYANKNLQIIVGAGIVGVSAAIELKTRYPELNVLVIDQYHPPKGASTKNAGFACFGSVTELIDDLSHMPREQVKEIVAMRWEGIKILEKRLSTYGYNIAYHGGTELFEKNEKINEEEVAICDSILEEVTGIANYFEIKPNTQFQHMYDRAIFMKSEGELDPMVMMTLLHKMALDLGVAFMHGRLIKAILHDEKCIVLDQDIKLRYEKLLICTNGFTKKLFPTLEVLPARNHVMVTNALKNLDLKGVYHYDKGYYYFRQVGNRLLLGGARNKDAENEYTDAFAYNEIIRTELMSFAKKHFEYLQEEIYPEYWWTGVLGVGPSKYPILQEIENNCYLAVRLGGMGVAIGSYLAKNLIQLAYK